MMQRAGLAALSAGGSDWLAQNEVEKESQQVREQGCNEYPENSVHGAPPGVRKYETEAQKPDSEESAEHQGEASISEHFPEHSIVISGLVSGYQPDQQSAAHDNRRPKLELLRDDIKKPAEHH